MSEMRSIDLTTERAITLADAAALLPPGRNGRPVTASCVLRWVLRGVRVRGARERVRLEALRIGGRWLTSKEAMQRFAEAQTPIINDAAPIRTPAARSRASDHADRQLRAIGM